MRTLKRAFHLQCKATDFHQNSDEIHNYEKKVAQLITIPF